MPNVGVLLDGFHLHAAGEPIEHGLAWGVDRVVWVHVADLPPGAPVDRARIVDAERGLPGAHEAVGTAQLLDRLARSGYDGPVTPEPMAGCLSLRGMSADKAVELVAEAMRSIWPAGRP
ncbi:MAG: TIM barrel protein [Isosphaeraceae bacterium]